MGLNKKKKINNAIRQTADHAPNDFFVYNNGISVLTTRFDEKEKKLEGISIINGAQTTGSIASAQNQEGLKNLTVMCRIIECNDAEKVKKIVQFNNTQNHITTWDHYTNSPEQSIIAEEFKKLGYTYSLKRGFDNSGSLFGIEAVAQPLVALHGDFVSANRGKNHVFETKSVYDNAFHESKAQHILLAYCISKSIERVKTALKSKQALIESEKKQLNFLLSLKAKHFITAVIGKIIETLIRKPVDSKFVKFTYNTSLSTNNSLDQLIDIWQPAIKAILPIIVSESGDDMYKFFSQENIIDTVANKSKNTIESIRALSPVEALDALSKHIE